METLYTTACRIIKDPNDVISMLSDMDSDDSDVSDVGEPLCTGSDDEFPLPEVDSGDER